MILSVHRISCISVLMIIVHMRFCVARRPSLTLSLVVLTDTIVVVVEFYALGLSLPLQAINTH